MTTSNFVFTTPTRVCIINNLSIRTPVHNVKTNQGSIIQSIQTYNHLNNLHQSLDVNETISLGHNDIENNGSYIALGDFKHTEMGDWVVTDIPTYQADSVAEFQNITPIRSHYQYLEYMWEDFHMELFGKNASDSFRGGMVTAHGDKAYGYKGDWEPVGIPFYHGVLLFLLTYINSELGDYLKSDSDKFVINKYQHYLPKIQKVERANLIWMQQPK